MAPPTSSGDPPPLPERVPNEPPPAYSETPQTTGTTRTSQSTGATQPTASSSISRPQGQDTSHLRVPGTQKARNGIPPDVRRSMEDEARELPEGWVRQFDGKSQHQFFVDTRSTPPRAIWHHPYDDDQYMNSLSSQERTRIQAMHRVPSDADIHAESSELDTDNEHRLPPREDKPKGASRFTRKMKDKLTGTTHEERERARQQRAKEEQAAYERHQHIRRCMARAMETGQRQFVGKDKNGQDVYIDPPPPGMGYGGGYGMQPGMAAGYPGAMGYGGGGYGWAAVPYGNNSTVLRPQTGYGRPYGGGYGGGLGLPLVGGLVGGALLGSLLF